MQPQQHKVRNITIISSIVFLIILTVGILGAMGFFHSNPFGKSTKIDNFSQYFKDVPTEKRDAVFAALHGTIESNLNESTEVPISGAIIRPGSVDIEYIEESLSNYSTFIVDIEAIQQTYQIRMAWSNNPKTTLAGYELLVICPTEEQLIYPAFECQDMISSDPLSMLYSNNPILSLLPIVISYYSNDNKLISYRISYLATNDYNDIKLIINDYTGGNYDRAIQTLKDRGISNPEQYEIEYIDDSIEIFIPPPDREE